MEKTKSVTMHGNINTQMVIFVCHPQSSVDTLNLKQVFAKIKSAPIQWLNLRQTKAITQKHVDRVAAMLLDGVFQHVCTLEALSFGYSKLTKEPESMPKFIEMLVLRSWHARLSKENPARGREIFDEPSTDPPLCLKAVVLHNLHLSKLDPVVLALINAFGTLKKIRFCGCALNGFTMKSQYNSFELTSDNRSVKIEILDS